MGRVRDDETRVVYIPLLLDAKCPSFEELERSVNVRVAFLERGKSSGLPILLHDLLRTFTVDPRYLLTEEIERYYGWPENYDVNAAAFPLYERDDALMLRSFVVKVKEEENIKLYSDSQSADLESVVMKERHIEEGN